ncbi:hypothetical protein GCM10009540_01500 [Streptomyces turgidiscabies]
MSTLSVRLPFDGHTPGITRRLWPLPWGRTSRIPLREAGSGADEGDELSIAPPSLSSSPPLERRHHNLTGVRTQSTEYVVGSRSTESTQLLSNQASVSRM